jgi:hypothetical protein
MRTTDVEMSVRGAHFAIALMQEDLWELNDIVTNTNNTVERIQVEDVAWCRSRISVLEKPNNPTNHSLWQLINSLLTRLECQEDLISDLKTGLARVHEKIGVLEMSSALVQTRVASLEDVMESSSTPTDLTLDDDSEYTDVDDGGAMMVEDSEEEQENVPPPPPILPHQDTPHPAPVFRSLILIKELAPTPVAEVVDVDAEGEDDAWYIPPIHHCQIQVDR